MKVEQGEVWRSLDPRDNGRTLYVDGVTPTHAVCLSRFKRLVRIRLDRLRPPYYERVHEAPHREFARDLLGGSDAD